MKLTAEILVFGIALIIGGVHASDFSLSERVYVYETWENRNSKDSQFHQIDFSWFEYGGAPYCSVTIKKFSSLACDDDSGGVIVSHFEVDLNDTRDGRLTGLPALQCTVEETEIGTIKRVRFVEYFQSMVSTHSLLVQKTTGDRWELESYNGNYVGNSSFFEGETFVGTYTPYDWTELKEQGGIPLTCRGYKHWFAVRVPLKYLFPNFGDRDD